MGRKKGNHKASNSQHEIPSIEMVKELGGYQEDLDLIQSSADSKKDLSKAELEAIRKSVASMTKGSGFGNVQSPANNASGDSAPKHAFKKQQEHVESLPQTQEEIAGSRFFGSRPDEKTFDFTRKLRELEERHHKPGISRSDAAFLEKVLRNGTLSDKIAAMSVRIQQEPEQSMDMLIRLTALGMRKGRREAVMALEALRDLFVNTLFVQFPDIKYFGDGGSFVEHVIKKLFTFFVEALSFWMKDSVTHSKAVAIRLAYDCLVAHSEQEDVLLSLIANKLGDPEKKIASQASFTLNRLLVTHPAMKIVVIDDVERFLFRSHLQDRGRYYALIFLNQIILTKSETLVAVRLIEIYISLFRVYSGLRVENDQVSLTETRNKKSKEKETRKLEDAAAESRMLSAVLTGISRAYPFASYSSDAQTRKKIMEFADHLFRIAHVGTFSTSTQSLTILFQIKKSADEGKFKSEEETSFENRYYRALYDALLSEDFPAASHPSLLLNLVVRSIRSDSNNDRRLAFLKRLLIVSSLCPTNVLCGIVYMVHRIINEFPATSTLIKIAPDHSDEYDFWKRDPLFAKADCASLYELNLLDNHFHPTVREFAQSMESGSRIPYEGDPLEDFSISSFLDKFVLRKPKKAIARGESLMQKIILAPEDDKQAFPKDAETVFVQRFLEVKTANDENDFSSKQKKNKKKRSDDVDNFDSDSSDGAEIDEKGTGEENGSDFGDDDNDDLLDDIGDDDDLPEFDEDDLDENPVDDDQSNVDNDASLQNAFAAAEDYQDLLEESSSQPRSADRRWERKRQHSGDHGRGGKRKKFSR
eukprot:ANDGO_03607.mRNA.1 Ribosome biogenesis protein MAK21